MKSFRRRAISKSTPVLSGLHHVWRKLSVDNSGVAAVEFAAVLPVVIVLLIMTADLSLGIYSKMRVENAAQYGVQYAATHGFNSSSIASAVSNNTSITQLSVTPSPYEVCGCAGGAGIESVACNSQCADGSSPGVYVNVTTQATYKTIIPYPIVPNSYTFVAQAMVRMQ